MPKKIKINYRFVSRYFNPDTHFFTRKLRKIYDVEISENPEYLFIGTHIGSKHKETPNIQGNFTTIFFTTENVVPLMEKYNWAFSYVYDDIMNHPRHMRLPLYVITGAGDNLIKDRTKVENSIRLKKRFCAFVYLKDAPERIAFFKKLSEYKHIDSPGRSMNNAVPIISNKFICKLAQIERAITKKSIIFSIYSRHFQSLHKPKINYLKQYKFAFAFENCAAQGYTTEKIYHAMLAGTVPIYWGNPRIDRDFNIKSLVHIPDRNCFDDAVKEIMKLDLDDDLYAEKLAEPWYNENKPNEYTSEERLFARFIEIFGK